MPVTLIKTQDEIKRLRESGKRLASVLQKVMESVRPGMTTLEIDTLAEKLIREAGGEPVFKGYGASSGVPFPASLCTSLNDEVVHGIPSQKRIVREGDILKLDIGLRFEGMVTDMARTLAIGSVSPEAKKLMEITEESLRRGIAALRPGVKLALYSKTVQGYVEQNGFSIVRELVGHGVGHELHEEPQVPNYFSSRTPDLTLEEGMALALEPMVNAGEYAVKMAPDQWTFATKDGTLSAHFEDTVVITSKGAEVMTKI